MERITEFTETSLNGRSRTDRSLSRKRPSRSPVDSARILQAPGEDIAVLSVVEGGKVVTFDLARAKLLVLLETGFEALRRQENR